MFDFADQPRRERVFLDDLTGEVIAND